MCKKYYGFFTSKRPNVHDHPGSRINARNVAPSCGLFLSCGEKNNSSDTSKYIHLEICTEITVCIMYRTMILHCRNELDLNIIGILLAYFGTQLMLTFSYCDNPNSVSTMSLLIWASCNSLCRFSFRLIYFSHTHVVT